MEDREIVAGLMKQLCRHFPDVPPEDIAEVVRVTVAEFADAHIRTYTRTLVEREAR